MAMQGGFGAKVKITVGTTLTAIVNLLDVDPPEQMKFLAEMTPHPTSGTTGYQQWVDAGKRGLGEFPMVLGWDTDETTHAAIMTAFDGTTSVNMSFEAPDADEAIAFAAFVRSVGRASKQEDGYKCTVRVQPTGAPTIT